MAGYVLTNAGYAPEFHIGAHDLSGWIRSTPGTGKVITLQLDGDELDAALWGLENYRKPTVRQLPEFKNRIRNG